MSVLMYSLGGLSIAVGALAAGQYLFFADQRACLAYPAARWARIRPAAKPRARRRTWNEFGIRLGTVLTGTLLVLSVGDAAAG